MNCQKIEADFLIIGGGSAGCMAAIRALELNPKLRVVIFEKSDLKYGGSIARGMDALNIVAIPNFTTPELYVEAITEGCAGICDAGPSYTMAARSFELLNKLAAWGVYFPRDEKGNFKTLKYHVKGEFQTCMEEPDLKVMIAKRATELGAKVINRTTGIRLLTDGNKVAGAVGINTRTGVPVVCHAKTVLLSNGGTARFSLPNSGYGYGVFDFPGNTGDGYVLGFDAGASLTGMEHANSAMLIKDASMPLLAITVTRGGRVKDMYGKVLMENEVADMKVMDDAYNRGEGPLRIQLSHLPEETIAEIEHILFSTERPVQERFFKGRGINFREQDIELWPTEAQLCGGHGLAGLRINSRAQTSVQGLYAAGDCANVPKQHLSGAFVFGEVAGEEAVVYAANNPMPHKDDDTVAEVLAERTRREELAGELTVADVERKARRLITDYLVSPKNAHKFERWGEWSPRLRHELTNNTKVTSGHDLAHLYEVENILRSADMSAAAGAFRTESRWGRSHYRADFPNKDDGSWLCHVILRKDSAGNIQVSKAPIQTQLSEEVAF